jgi:hypothetical protein
MLWSKRVFIVVPKRQLQEQEMIEDFQHFELVLVGVVVSPLFNRVAKVAALAIANFGLQPTP